MAQTCVHHWLLEAGVRDVPARCRKCRARRIFTGLAAEDLDSRARRREWNATGIRRRPVEHYVTGGLRREV